MLSSRSRAVARSGATVLTAAVCLLGGCASLHRALVPEPVFSGAPVTSEYVCVIVNPGVGDPNLLLGMEMTLRNRGIRYGIWSPGTEPGACDTTMTYQVTLAYADPPFGPEGDVGPYRSTLVVRLYQRGTPMMTALYEVRGPVRRDVLPRMIAPMFTLRSAERPPTSAQETELPN